MQWGTELEGNQSDVGRAAPECAPVPAGSAGPSGTLSSTSAQAEAAQDSGAAPAAAPGLLKEFSPSLACAALRSCRARAVRGTRG